MRDHRLEVPIRDQGQCLDTHGSVVTIDTMTVAVRYIVSDVDAALPFYRDLLGFAVELHRPPSFAIVSKGALRLLLNQPGAGGAGQLPRRHGSSSAVRSRAS